MSEDYSRSVPAVNLRREGGGSSVWTGVSTPFQPRFFPRYFGAVEKGEVGTLATGCRVWRRVGVANEKTPGAAYSHHPGVPEFKSQVALSLLSPLFFRRRAAYAGRSAYALKRLRASPIPAKPIPRRSSEVGSGTCVPPPPKKLMCEMPLSRSSHTGKVPHGASTNQTSWLPSLDTCWSAVTPKRV
jgi:hypothetical protein